MRSPRRILIVDDERAVRSSLRMTLVAEGFDVEEAASGREAVIAVSRGNGFDAIVLDSRLPDTRAIDLLDEIKHFAPRTPVIVMTTVTERPSEELWPGDASTRAAWSLRYARPSRGARRMLPPRRARR